MEGELKGKLERALECHKEFQYDTLIPSNFPSSTPVLTTPAPTTPALTTPPTTFCVNDPNYRFNDDDKKLVFGS